MPLSRPEQRPELQADQKLVLPTQPSLLAALLLAVDARGLGGLLLDHPVHESVRLLTEALRAWMPQYGPGPTPLRRLPAGISADRLYGGVDLAATLTTGRLVSDRGVLAAADGGLLVVPMAERLGVPARTALCEVLDHGEVVVARDGVNTRHASRLCVVLLDESHEDEQVHAALADRLAFCVTMNGDAHALLTELSEPAAMATLRARLRDARDRLARISMDDAWAAELCTTAAICGVDSVRASLFAVRCARAHAALHGRLMVTAEDAQVAAALVLAPRATRVPTAQPPEADESSPPPERDAAQPPDASQSEVPPPDPARADHSAPPEEEQGAQQAPAPEALPAELLRAAVEAALPPGLLQALLGQQSHAGTVSGRVGETTANLLRGIPRGARGGLPRGGARLHLLETLRAAAPWQRARLKERSMARQAPVQPTARNPRLNIRREDFRVRQFLERTGTTVLFAVDASGSSAVHRFAEAKGAVELLLAESYARRDRVSLLAFRGTGTELLLPPTRALARARRVLAALPGGGGTPMATAIDAVIEQALQIRRSGSSPLIVFLTDGRANIARDGMAGRARAEQDALAASAQLAAQRLPVLFVDTSPRGEPMARRLAEAMRARYVPLPVSNSEALGMLVKQTKQLSATGSGARTP
ncbi:MAG: magnesium chelatase ATPase subunit D [Gemmatimonas sp.]|nr:magnesium chelatase ATPase subunit D [Gemmatimonas sp.]